MRLYIWVIIVLQQSNFLYVKAMFVTEQILKSYELFAEEI